MKKIDNYFVDKTGKSDEITIDCGSPSTLAGKKVIESYLKKNKIEKEDLEKETVDKTFRFRETLYKSNEKLSIPIKVKCTNSWNEPDEYKGMIDTYIIDGNTPWLYGLNTFLTHQGKLDVGGKN